MRRLRACRADWAAVNHRLARAGVLAQCHRAGIKTMIWTVDEDAEMSRWLADPRVTVRNQLLPSLVLKAGAGFYHRPPLPSETDPVFGNPNLNAEHSHNFEVGFDQYLRGATLSITGFRSTYVDLISYDVIANKFGNVDRAKAHGVELAASRRFGPLDASISYTWQKAVDAGRELVQRHRRIGSDGEKCRRAEIHVAAIAAEDVPGGRQHDELQDRVAGEIEVIEV